jgi:hypothetical protein
MIRLQFDHDPFAVVPVAHRVSFLQWPLLYSATTDACREFGLLVLTALLLGKI